MQEHLTLPCRYCRFDVVVVGWLDVGEIASRIVRYISSASHVVQLLVSEAILTSKDRK